MAFKFWLKTITEVEEFDGYWTHRKYPDRKDIGDSYSNPQTRCHDLPTVQGRKMCNRLQIITLQDLAKHTMEELMTTESGKRVSNADWRTILYFLSSAGLSFKGRNLAPWDW